MKYFRPLILTVLMLTGISAAHAQWVYKTPSGAKYHKADCHTVKNVSEQLRLADAAKAGLAPCKICKPPVTTQAAYSSGSKQAAGQANSTQCRGTTKAGARCRHLTRIGNGYCFQHQPGR